MKKENKMSDKIQLSLEQATLAFDILELMEKTFPEVEDIPKNIPVLMVLLESITESLLEEAL
jgi:hypothetical protein